MAQHSHSRLPSCHCFVQHRDQVAWVSTFLVQVAGSLAAEGSSHSLGELEEVVRNPRDYKLE